MDGLGARQHYPEKILHRKYCNIQNPDVFLLPLFAKEESMNNIQRCDNCGELTDEWFQTGVKEWGSMEVGTWCSDECYKEAEEPVFESKKPTYAPHRNSTLP